jgi:hypothetical protein
MPFSTHRRPGHRGVPDHGDYGGTASTDLSAEEAVVVVDAGEFTDPRVPLDDDETALVTRLRSLLS